MLTTTEESDFHDYKMRICYDLNPDLMHSKGSDFTNKEILPAFSPNEAKSRWLTEGHGCQCLNNQSTHLRLVHKKLSTVDNPVLLGDGECQNQDKPTPLAATQTKLS